MSEPEGMAGQIGEGWGDLDDALRSDFIKWAEAPFKLHFHSDPIMRVNHWVGGRPSPCEGEGCPHCAKYKAGDENYKPKTSVLFEVLMLEDGAWVPRKFDMSLSAVRILKELKDQLGEDNFRNQAIACSKTGQAASTKYTFAPLGPAKALVGSKDGDNEMPF